MMKLKVHPVGGREVPCLVETLKPGVFAPSKLLDVVPRLGAFAWIVNIVTTSNATRMVAAVSNVHAEIPVCEVRVDVAAVVVHNGFSSHHLFNKSVNHPSTRARIFHTFARLVEFPCSVEVAGPIVEPETHVRAEHEF